MIGGRFARVGLAVLLTASLAAPLTAQDGRGRRSDSQDREELMERVRARMAEMMQKRLGLTDEESEHLSEVVRRFDQRRGELWRDDNALRRSFDALEDSEVDEDQASRLLQQMIEQRRRESELFEEELNGLLEVLTPSQVIQFQSLRQEMGRRIRSLRGDDGRDGGDGDDRRRRRGPGGGDGPSER